jgi:hypothetical protein
MVTNVPWQLESTGQKVASRERVYRRDRWRRAMRAEFRGASAAPDENPPDSDDDSAPTGSRGGRPPS